MNNLINFDKIESYIKEKKLFDIAHQALKEYLCNWWEDDKNSFLEDMGADLNTVIEKYKFENKCFSINANYLYDPTMYYYSATIRILDEEDNYVAEYTAFFDIELNIFDDYLH